MAFALFEPLFKKIDSIAQTFVNDFSTRVIAEATPFVLTGLSISFLLMSILIMRGVIQRPLMDFLGRSISIAVIVSFSISGGLYQSQLTQVIVSAPDELASKLIGSDNISSAANVIDKAADSGFKKAGEAADLVGLSASGVMFAFIWLVIIVVTAIMAAVGGAFMISAKLALALLAGIGPFFIAALIFKPTQRFFEQWMGQVLTYGFLIVFFSAMFGLMMSIFTNYMDDVKLDGIQNVSYTVGGCLILGTVTIFLLFQLPKIAASLSGGMSLSHGQISKLAGQALSSMMSSSPPNQNSGSGGGGGGGAPRREVHGSGSGSGGGASGSSGRAPGSGGKPAGHFKGDRAA